MRTIASHGRAVMLCAFAVVGCSTTPPSLPKEYCARYPTVRGCPGVEQALAAKYSDTDGMKPEPSAQGDGKAIKEPALVRLLVDNLDQQIKKLVIQNVEQNRLLLVVDKASKQTYEVSVKQRELLERERQERTQTIRYGQHQLNMLGAVFYMPNNATYAYDLTTGGIDIQYSYWIRITRGGNTVFEDSVSGTAKADYGFCTDARIQNVFGGIEPAPFIANSDMQQRCTQKQEADRGYACKAIADAITRAISTNIAKDIAERES